MSSKMLRMKEKMRRINPLKSPKMVIGNPIPSPKTIAASAAMMKASAEITAARLARANSIATAAAGPPPNPPPKGALPDEPLFTRHRATLFVLANESHKGRAEFLEAMPAELREVIERLQEMVFQEMELRGVAMAHAMSLGKNADEADLTELQKKDAKAAHLLPPPFSSTLRRVDTMSVLPVSPTLPRPYEGASLKMHDMPNHNPKPDDTVVGSEMSSQGGWETATDMSRYGALFSKSPAANPVRVTADGGRFSGSTIAKDKKSSSINETPKKPRAWNKNFQDIVDDFIAQETGLLRHHNSLVFDSRRSEKDASIKLEDAEPVIDPVNQAIVDNASIVNTPLIRVTSTEGDIKSPIFEDKDALQTSELPTDFRGQTDGMNTIEVSSPLKNSASAPGRLTRSNTVLFHPQFLDESKSMGDLPPTRSAPPPPVENDGEEDLETPRRITPSFVGGMRRMNTMSDLHAKPTENMSDAMYSKADEIASPVPFRATIDAGNNARNRRLGQLQLDSEEQATWGAKSRYSVMELKEQAIVAKRLKEEEEAAKPKKPLTPKKEKRKKAYIDKRQKDLEYSEQQMRLFKEQADQHRRSLEDADRDDFSPPKEDGSSPLLMGKQGSEAYLRRDALTQFSKSELFSDSDMPTPTQMSSGTAAKLASPGNFFSSPTRKRSPLAQPPLNAKANMSMSNFDEATSGDQYLSGFPIPMESKKLQKRPMTGIPNLAHTSSDDKLPSSPSNRRGVGLMVGKWKNSLGRSGRSREVSFSDVPEVDEVDPKADWGRSGKPKKKIEHSQSLMAMFQEPPKIPATPAKDGLSPSQFAPGMVLRDTSGIFSLGRRKGHRRSDSEQKKLKKLYEDQINAQGSYITPSINRGGDVATPAPVYVRMHGLGVERETTPQRQEYHERRFAEAAVELNNDMRDMNVDEDDGKNADEQFVKSPASFNSDALSNTPLSQNPNRCSQAPFGTVSSLKKKLELAGAKSAPFSSSEAFAKSSSGPVASTTPSGTPNRRVTLGLPDDAPLSSSPLNRVMSAPESPEKEAMIEALDEALTEDLEQDVGGKSSRRSFLPNSRTIPNSLVTHSTVTRQDPGPVNRSPERVPYIDRSGSLARLSSMMNLNNPRNEDDRSFARFARNLMDFADGKRKRASRME